MEREAKVMRARYLTKFSPQSARYRLHWMTFFLVYVRHHTFDLFT
jgi:hypothetical protein